MCSSLEQPYSCLTIGKYGPARGGSGRFTGMMKPGSTGAGSRGPRYPGACAMRRRGAGVSPVGSERPASLALCSAASLLPEMYLLHSLSCNASTHGRGHRRARACIGHRDAHAGGSRAPATARAATASAQALPHRERSSNRSASRADPASPRGSPPHHRAARSVGPPRISVRRARTCSAPPCASRLRPGAAPNTPSRRG